MRTRLSAKLKSLRKEFTSSFSQAKIIGKTRSNNNFFISDRF